MILVTGGAGFIGSNLVHALNAAGADDIVVADDLTDGDKCRNLSRARFLDLIDSDDLFARLNSLPKIDAVLHQGACSATTERDGRFLLRNNIEYSKRLITWCLEREVPVLFASSASVYGEGDHGFCETADSEEPLNAYAFSKWVVDCWIRRQLPKAKSQLVSLRYFNVYGPNEIHKAAQGMCSPILHFHRQIAEDGAIKLFAGSDNFRRDFVHVDDCCAVNRWFIEHDVSGIFNCGTGTARSFADVAQAMEGCYDNATVTEVPFPDHLKGKYQAFTQADLTKLREAGCDHDFTTLEDGIARYVEILKTDGGYRR